MDAGSNSRGLKLEIAACNQSISRRASSIGKNEEAMSALSALEAVQIPEPQAEQGSNEQKLCCGDASKSQQSSG